MDGVGSAGLNLKAELGAPGGGRIVKKLSVWTRDRALAGNGRGRPRLEIAPFLFSGYEDTHRGFGLTGRPARCSSIQLKELLAVSGSPLPMRPREEGKGNVAAPCL